MFFNKKEIEGHSIIIIGTFNPQIFSPSWLALEGLIGQNEVMEAKIEVIAPDISSFSLDWMSLEVTRERFKITSNNSAHYEPVRDLCISILTILRHTPVVSMGFNFDYHFGIQSKDNQIWEEFSNKISPKQPWKSIFSNPELMSINIAQKRESGFSGHTLVAIQPSLYIKDGVFFLVNDHFEIKNPFSEVLKKGSTKKVSKDSKLLSENKTIGADEFVEVLNSYWETSLKNSEKIIEKIWHS
jgi:hypothetical protein